VVTISAAVRDTKMTEALTVAFEAQFRDMSIGELIGELII
jgi:hypothetical protein